MNPKYLLFVLTLIVLSFSTYAECGNGICEDTEIRYCPSDCEEIENVCGDGICSYEEDIINCEQDCHTTTEETEFTITASATPTTGPSPLQVQFSCSHSGGQEPVVAVWDLADGTNQIQNNPTHTYTMPGTYLTMCTLTDAQGSFQQEAIKIEVTNSANDDPTLGEKWCCKDGNIELTDKASCDAKGGTVYANEYEATMNCVKYEEFTLTADLIADKTSGPAPLTVNFQCVASGDNKPLSFSWDFGEGVASTQQNPTHTYTVEGVYGTACTAIDSQGNSASDSIFITVGSTTTEPGEKWCCSNGEIEMTDKTTCDQRGGKLYDKVEDAEKNCKKGTGNSNVDLAITKLSCDINQKKYYKKYYFTMTNKGDKYKGNYFIYTYQYAKDGSNITGIKLEYDEIEKGKEENWNDNDINEMNVYCGMGIEVCVIAFDLPTNPNPSTEDILKANKPDINPSNNCKKSTCACGTTTTTSGEKWCCSNGQIEMTDKTTCDQKKGTYHNTLTEAEKKCFTTTSGGELWCCYNNQVELTDQATCNQKGGTYHNSVEDAEKKCFPTTESEEKWCCFEGQIDMTDKASCDSKGGTYHGSVEDAEMMCFPETEGEEKFCCHEGIIDMTDLSNCESKGGSYHETFDEAEMNCFSEETSEEFFCCNQGIVDMSDLDSCEGKGGTIHGTFDEADKECFEQKDLDEKYCCMEGNIILLPDDQCTKDGGSSHEDIDEAGIACEKGSDGDHQESEDDGFFDRFFGQGEDERREPELMLEKIIDPDTGNEIWIDDSSQCKLCSPCSPWYILIWIVLICLSVAIGYTAYKKKKKFQRNDYLIIILFVLLPIILGLIIGPCWAILAAIIEFTFIFASKKKKK